MNSIKIITFVFLITLASCSSNTESSATVTAADIENKIEVLKGENALDQTKVADLLESIDAFVAKNENDAKTPKFLELKAKYLTALNKNQEAFLVYKEIYEDFDNFLNHSDALFMMAFISENNLNNKSQAELFYQKYLDEFPEGDFANDAQFSLDNMNKTPEELMEMFKKMNENANDFE